MNADLHFPLRVRTRSAVGSVLALLSVTVAACSDDITRPTAAEPAPGLAAAMVPNSWATRARMPTARSGLVTATSNGVIYAIGGQNADGNALAKVEAFKPGTSTLVAWSPKAPLPTARFYPNGAATINGKIYVPGGVNAQGQATSTLFVYDPVGNAWFSKAPMPIASSGGAAVAIAGKLYVLATQPGEDQFFTGPTRLFRYDPATNSWTERASAPNHHFRGAARAIDGKLYVAGGLTFYWDDAPRPRTWAQLDVYDPATNVWTTKAPMPAARFAAAGGVVNGKLYVAGGSKTGISPLVSTLEVYNPATNSWAARADMPTARWDAAGGVVNGVLYVLGGAVLVPPHMVDEVVRMNEAYAP
jgi:N-acetylneuraminic acid mutarotase